jgi:hypothetical protein
MLAREEGLGWAFWKGWTELENIIEAWLNFGSEEEYLFQIDAPYL